MRKILLAVLVCLPFCVPQPGHASLIEQYAADADGNIEVPALTALASSIVGYPATVYCAPVDPKDPDQPWGWVYSYSVQNDDGSWTTIVEPNIYIRGDICAELVKLTSYASYRRVFRQRSGPVAPLNQHTYTAAEAILTLTHEAMHVKLQSEDEGVVECTAIHNVWPTIAALRLPNWLNKLLLWDSMDAHLLADDQYLTVC